jgi:uncharacterized damage-inducible protein DinB
MKDIFLSFARANEEADKIILSILDSMSHEDRMKNRKSYYKSLASLAVHTLEGTFFFLSLFRETAAKNAKALKALDAAAKVEIPDGKKLSEEDWAVGTANFKIVDKAYIDFVAALEDGDFSAPVKINWYKGKPAEVPLSFMLQQLVSHGIHHRGQISQILDSLKIDNDYSGINVKFLSK